MFHEVDPSKVIIKFRPKKKKKVIIKYNNFETKNIK